MTDIDKKKVDELLQLLDTDSMYHAIEAKDLAKRYEEYMHIDEEILSIAAEISDVGKIYISEWVLNKPGKLTQLEQKIVKMHPYYGFELLKDNEIDERISNLVLYHHGLNPPHIGDIPEFDPTIEQYVLALDTIDRFVALTENRPYRKKRTPEEAIIFLEDDSKEEDKNVIAFLKDSYL